MTRDFSSRVEAALQSVRLHHSAQPRIGIILGSGLSALARNFGGTEIDYTAIAGFPAPTVSGHAGILCLGDSVAVMAGRYHCYEGHGMDTVLLPAALLRALGVQTLIITNAAGSLRPEVGPGSLVLINDHLNLMGLSPLEGPHLQAFGPRFPDMSAVYSPRLRSLAHDAANSAGIIVSEGVYAAVRGPCYETPAEIRAFKTLGADLVGMSTVPESIFARSAGMDILGISLVTNLAAGLGGSLDHAEVMKAGADASAKLSDLLQSIVKRIAV